MISSQLGIEARLLFFFARDSDSLDSGSLGEGTPSLTPGSLSRES